MDADLVVQIRSRATAEQVDLVVLPLRVDERSGRAVYAENTLFLVKRLRAEGVRAAYLDDPDDRVFVSENSAVLAAVGSLALGIVGSAAYDGLKALVQRLWRKDSAISLTIIDATEATPAEWSATGPRGDIVKAIEELQTRGLLPAGMPATENRATTGDPPPDWTYKIPSDRVNALIDERIAEGRRLADEAEAMLAASPENRDEANQLAVSALRSYRSALNWAEDTSREDEAHQQMDAAGRRKRRTFECKVEYEDGTYFDTCPVSLGHVRVGFSVGGTATRRCSLCADDLSVCEHDPARTYLVPGGSALDDYCRICMVKECDEHKTHLLYEATPVSVITEMHMDEVSLVARPAQPDARIERESMSIERLRAGLGDDFSPGVALSCDKCLDDCDGLIQVKLPSRTEPA